LNFVIEPLSKKDLEQCTSLILSSMRKELILANQNKEAVKSLLYGTNALSLVGKKDDQIVGLISGIVQMPLRISFLNVVDEESARQGLGGLLIDKFLEVAKKRLPNAPYATTSLPADNTVAISLYSARGFKIEGFLKEGIMGKDIVFLKKKL